MDAAHEAIASLPPWSVAELADVVAAALQRRRDLDNAEQAVYGFDSLAELKLHPLIHAAFRDAGYGVFPELRYPAAKEKRKKSEGQRCDLVLTRDSLPLREREEQPPEGSLFAAVPQPASEDADSAYWLEVKTVSQFSTEGPFPRYSAELFAPVAKDVKKLHDDALIRHGGLLLVLFTHTQAVAEHDLVAWHDRCIVKGFPVRPPSTRGFPITDRIGNGWCAVALFPIKG